MYKKGDYIVYGMNGPCLVKNVTKLSMPGVDDKRKYYVLQPVNAPKSTIYCPIDNDKVPIRDIMSKNEAQKLIREVPKISRVRIDNEKLREEQYKEIIKNGDFKKCVGLLKALNNKRQSRLDEGRKFTTVDEKYLREVEGMLCSELAIALGEDREKTTKRLWEKIETKKKPEKKTEKKPEKAPEKTSDKKTEKKAEKKTEKTPEKKAAKKTDKKAEKKPEKKTAKKPEKKADKNADKKADKKPEKKAKASPAKKTKK